MILPQREIDDALNSNNITTNLLGHRNHITKLSCRLKETVKPRVYAKWIRYTQDNLFVNATRIGGGCIAPYHYAL